MANIREAGPPIPSTECRSVDVFQHDAELKTERHLHHKDDHPRLVKRAFYPLVDGGVGISGRLS
jgi:hypothetical protein